MPSEVAAPTLELVPTQGRTGLRCQSDPPVAQWSVRSESTESREPGESTPSDVEPSSSDREVQSVPHHPEQHLVPHPPPRQVPRVDHPL